MAAITRNYETAAIDFADGPTAKTNMILSTVPPENISAGLAGFAVASFAIAITPGASWMYAITTTIHAGRKAGFIGVVGNATGIIVHMLAAAVGLSAVLNYSPATFRILQYAGSAYLIYLALKTVVERTDFTSTTTSELWWGVFRGGLMVNVLNPKAALLMFALLPQFVDVESSQAVGSIFACGLIHVLMASCTLTVVVCLSGWLRETIRRSAATETMIRYLAAAILIAISVRLLV